MSRINFRLSEEEGREGRQFTQRERRSPNKRKIIGRVTSQGEYEYITIPRSCL